MKGDKQPFGHSLHRCFLKYWCREGGQGVEQPL